MMKPLSQKAHQGSPDLTSPSWEQVFDGKQLLSSACLAAHHTEGILPSTEGIRVDVRLCVRVGLWFISWVNLGKSCLSRASVSRL